MKRHPNGTGSCTLNGRCRTTADLLRAFARANEESRRAEAEDSGCYCVVCLRQVPSDVFEARDGHCSIHRFGDSD